MNDPKQRLLDKLSCLNTVMAKRDQCYGIVLKNLETKELNPSLPPRISKPQAATICYFSKLSKA
jgi:hypothetical protein